MKVFSPFLNGDTTTSGSLNLPQHPTASAIINPNTGSIYHDTTDNVVRVYTGTQWQVVGEQTTPASAVNTDIEYLLVAGAGGGGGGGWGAGGGGAGGMLSSSLSSVTSGSSFTITVGAGGAGQAGGNSFTSGGDGIDSSIAGATISTITATGGGGGGAESANSGLGRSGGSGGGSTNANASGGSGTAGQGNDGGAGDAATSPGYPGGGGGGKGSVGSDASGNNGGDGGTGQASSITGTSLFYAGGGGGGTRSAGLQGIGGSSIGGDGANSGTAATSATVNRGAGGGGAEGSAAGSNGSSGVAIFAYDSGSFNCAGGIVGDAGNGRKYHQFNASNTFKIGSTSDFQIVSDSLVLNLDAGDFASRGASTWTDTVNGQNATISTGTPTLGSNFYYSLDGSGDIFSFTPSNVNSSLNGDHTWEFWVYPTATTEEDIIGSWGEPVSTAPGDFLYMIYNGKFRPHYITSTTVESMDTTTSISTNTWYHIVTVIDFTNSIMKVFINGTQDATTNALAGAGSTSSDAVYIGNRNTGTGTSDYTGRIAQIRFYSKALSASEITQNYEATKTNFV